MARLSEGEKAEFLADALSGERREVFAALREGARKSLSPDELMAFLNWAQQFMNEDVSKRGPMKGDRFLM